MMIGHVRDNFPRIMLTLPGRNGTEVITLEGRPLLGNVLLEGCQLQIDMTDGGEVVIDFS